MIYRIQRHIFFRITKAFLLFVLLIFFTFSFLDFCTKASDMTDSSLGYGFAFKYYFSEFAKKAYLFVPICFSLTILLQFIHLIKTKELIALLSSGMTYKKVLAPFWTLALIVSSFLLINREFIVPPTRHFLETYRNDHVKTQKKSRHSNDEIYTLILKDDSKLIYQNYDPQAERYFDLFWIVSPQRILRIKYLDKTQEGYKARFVDEMTRNQIGTFQKKHTFKELKLSKEWLKGAHLDKTLPIQTHDASQMIKGFGDKEYTFSKNEIITEIILVLIMSLAPMWLLLLQAPMIKQYSRQIPVLFYVASSLLFFFSSATILDGFGVICQRGIVSPWLLIFAPCLVLAVHILRRYRKILV